VFGIGRAPQLLATRDIEVCLTDLLNSIEENEEAWIITPYATMKQLSSQRRAIAEAAKRKANISFVVRDEENQVTPVKEDLSEAISSGLKVFSFFRLHAKVYWFEKTACILTSANLVDGSFEASTEIGLVIDAGNSLHDQVREWIKVEIEPGLKKIFLNSDVKQQNFKNRYSNNGHCIRCNKEIEYNQEKPYCVEHYKSWGKYSNPEYTEKYCHKCGKEYETSMKKPICFQCFKKG
jgi:phosphatidylserine/phosphatidylglycerophosphate/cardiolipin synthase-like enzyme